MNANVLKSLSNEALLFRTRELVDKSLVLEADLIEYLGEVDERKLYLDNACSSMFVFCMKEFGFSESAAYNRIAVARAGRKLPAVIAALQSGKVHLAGLRVLVPHLTQLNCELLLNEAAGKSKKEIEEIAARLAPRDPVPSSIWLVRGATRARPGPAAQQAFSAPVPPSTEVVPPTAPAACSQAVRAEVRPETAATVPAAQPLAVFPVHPPERAVLAPLSGETFKVQFTASRELRDKLVEAQDLLGHRVPDGDLAKIIESGLDLLIAKAKKEQFGVGRTVRGSSGASPKEPEEVPDGLNPPTRHIPDAIKRAVYERDGGRCTFVDERGRRCASRHALEFDHEDGFARTGCHDVKTIRLLCRAHNQHSADKMYGRAFMDRARAVRAATTNSPRGELNRDPSIAFSANDVPCAAAP